MKVIYLDKTIELMGKINPQKTQDLIISGEVKPIYSKEGAIIFNYLLTKL